MFQFCMSSGVPVQRHFLDSCYLCHKRLASNSDIFMYRGNTPFCSKDCRKQQIEMDESKENNKNAKRVPSSQSSAIMFPSDQNNDSSSPSDAAVRSSVAAVA